MTKDQREKTKEQCTRLYGRFIDEIADITIRITDIHKPRGGVDKECQTQVSLKSGGRLMAVKRHKTLSQAINQSLTAVRATLRRRLGERKPQTSTSS